MRFLKSFAIAAALAVPVLAVSVPAHAMDEDAVVKYRKFNMAIVGGAMQNIAAQLQGRAPVRDQIAEYATILHQASALSIPAFKPETMGVEERTTAVADIWANWDRFEGGLKKLEEETGKLAEAAATGNMAAVGAQLQQVGGTCKACHDNFRRTN